MNIWFTADLHLGHTNILKHQPNRAFASIEEHDQHIVDHWNSHVDDRDQVYFLGDLTMKPNGDDAKTLLDRLKGNIYVIRGNHDYALREAFDNNLLSSRIQDLGYYHKLRHNKKKIILCHFPFWSWDGMRIRPERPENEPKKDGSWHLHGHSHGKSPTIFDRLDVGWDCHNKILHIDDIWKILDQ